MSSSTPPRTNYRRNLRVPVRVEVVSTEEESSRGYAINVSRTGMGLQSAEPYKPGCRLRLRFRFCPTDDWIELDAEVIWCMRDTDLGPGMIYYELGVRFLDVPARELALLESFVERTVRDCSVDDSAPDNSFG